MKDKIILRVLTLFGVALAVLVFVTLAAIRNINRATAGSDWVNHTHAVIMEADALLSSFHAGDGALRTFLLTGDQRDLVATREAFGQMSEHFEVLKALAKDEAAHAPKFARLQVLFTERMEFAREVIAAREKNDAGTVRRLLAASAGSEATQEITRLIDKLQLAERELLTARDKASYLQAQTTRWTVFSGLIINFLLLGGAAWLIRDDIAARKRAAALLGEANATLEAKVRERTVELVASNGKLLAENQERQWGNHALEHQLRYNQLIINSITDLVVVLTKMGNVTRVNPAVTQWTGWSAAEMINQPLRRLIRLKPPDGGGGPAAADPVGLALKAGRELHEQRAEMLAQDGRTAPARLSMYPLRDRDKVVGAVVTIHILTNPV
jgi:PAS domain S-box-containing protein